MFFMGWSYLPPLYRLRIHIGSGGERSRHMLAPLHTKYAGGGERLAHPPATAAPQRYAPKISSRPKTVGPLGGRTRPRRTLGIPRPCPASRTLPDKIVSCICRRR